MLRIAVAALCLAAACALAAAGARGDPPPPAPPPGNPPAPGGPQPAPPEDPRQSHREAREAIRSGHFDAPTTAWREGPVRYLISADEDQEFRRLQSRDERARFITRFWEK